jgi:hypothetical protein
MNINKEDATAKWLRNLNNIKSEILLSKYTTLQKITAKHNMSNYWGSFLYSNNIVYKDESGFLKWNEKIPITVLLIKKFRIYKKQKVNHHPSIIKKQQEMKSIQKPLAPKTRKKRTPAVVIEQTPQPQVGLIRKFLRWLY